MTTLTCLITTAVAAGAAAITPVAAQAAPTAQHCTSIRPALDFYAGGRMASVPIRDRNAACSTISVSAVRDAADPSDRCQTFLVALLPADGRDPTYTEPVQACRGRTVLATGVPAGVRFRVLYQVDYIDPSPQVVRFRVWR